jgi:dCTP deaminase
MILSGKEIEKRIGHDIIIEPYSPSQLNPNSYNLRLHNELMVYDNYELDMKKENTATKLIIPEDGLLLEPHKLYLGRTLEFTETKSYVPMLEGRSSIGRLGMFIHVTAGFGDVGFLWLLDFGDFRYSAFTHLSWR